MTRVYKLKEEQPWLQLLGNRMEQAHGHVDRPTHLHFHLCKTCGKHSSAPLPHSIAPTFNLNPTVTELSNQV